MSFSLTVTSGMHRLLSSQSPERHFRPVHVSAHWYCMSQLSTPNLNTQAFSFQGSHIFANLTCISLIQSLQLLVPSYGTESPKSRPNSKLVFNSGHVLVIPASFFPTPSLVSTLFCHPILPFLVLAFTPLSLYPPLFISLPFFSHCFLSSSFSPYSPHIPYFLYISHPSTQHDNFPLTVDSLILLPIDPFKICSP